MPVAFLSSEGSSKRKVFESFWQSRSPSLVLICYLQQTCDSIPQSRKERSSASPALKVNSHFPWNFCNCNLARVSFYIQCNAMKHCLFCNLEEEILIKLSLHAIFGNKKWLLQFRRSTRGLRYPGQFLSVARLLHECNKTFLKIIWWSSTIHDNLFWSTPTHKQQSWR